METRAKRAKQLAFNNGAWVMWGLVLQFVPRDEVNDVLCISRNLHEFSIPIRSLVVLWYGNALTAIQQKTMVGIGKCSKGIRDADLKHLKGIHTVNLRGCNRITDNGLEHLKGIHTLNLSWCKSITDNGLKHHHPKERNAKRYHRLLLLHTKKKGKQ